MWIKTVLFLSTVFTVKYIFILINSYGDKKVDKMKELISFTEYLRIYSCEMKMSIEEIFLKYKFKSTSTKEVVSQWMKYLENKSSREDLLEYLDNIMNTPREFNLHFVEIIDYYGSSYSDVLNKKLAFTQEEMEKVMNEFYTIHSEKKALYNRISFLAGCLAAIILV
ncbi:MAG: hypothetical protein GX339_01490 [Tissierellia bacterium]|nr:hypothetical protein [Tissierellia bacterium]